MIPSPGVPGSHDQAIRAVRDICDVGIEPGVNTQINALSMPQLPQIFDEIVAAGAKYWQVQLTVAMGNAVDNAAMLLQPHQIIDVVDCLASLYHKGRDVGLRLLPGNSIGYFGRHEPYGARSPARSSTGPAARRARRRSAWRPTAPSKAARRCRNRISPAARPASMSIDDALRNLESRTVRRDGNRGRSFCGSCYYWSTCRGGCTWVSHVLEGKRGDNPYCYYRATTLAKRGLREKIVKVAEAPDEPFAVGRFEVRLEREDGSRAPRSLGLDDKRRKRGRLVLCQSCDEYMYAAEKACPHCGSSIDLKPAIDETPMLDLQATIAEIEHHGRRILEIAGLAGEMPAPE